LGLLGGALVLAVVLPAAAQQTVGLFVNEAPQDGLTLFTPNAFTVTYLIHNDGLLVHSWAASDPVGLMAYLLENGHLLRATRIEPPHPNFGNIAGRGGRVEEYDWDGTLLWQFDWSDADHLAHHDIEPLPGGNVLLIAFDQMPQAEALAAGRDPADAPAGGIRLESIVEVEPTPPVGGTIVWEWHARDHLIQDLDPTKANFGVVEDHPELIDFNYNDQRNLFHFNGIAYNEQLDQIVVSSRALSEVWVIDHSTTTAEAAGHSGGDHDRGGDLLYRWGNPLVYRRGSVADQKLVGQHDPTWVAGEAPGAFNLVIFNNGFNRPSGLSYSSVDEIVVPLDSAGLYPALAPGEAFGPANPVWSYQSVPPEEFFSRNQGGAQRLPGGNTLICQTTQNRLFEVTQDGTLVWEYVSPVNAAGPVDQGAIAPGNSAFKIRRYPMDYPGFAGRDLTPGDPIESFTAPLPVPSASLLADRSALDGSGIDLQWDAVTCSSFDYHLIFGQLANVASYSIDGAECGVGITGGYVWSNVPASDLFFLIVGTDDTGVYESSWGLDDAGHERHSTRAAFQCGTTTKVLSATCP